MLNAGDPGPSLLRRLAPALGLHESDLFVIAGRKVPDDLSPLDATAATVIGSLAWSLSYLPGAVPELHRLVQSLPQQPRSPGSPPPTPAYQRYPSNAGSLVLRLLQNRNLDWNGAARWLFGLGGGDMLSASTIGMIGHGRKALTPELLAGFADVLDISRRDLSVLTGSVSRCWPGVHGGIRRPSRMRSFRSRQRRGTSCRRSVVARSSPC